MVMGFQDRPMIKTFGFTVPFISTGVTTGTFTWNSMTDFTTFAELYQYFVPTSYRCTISTSATGPGPVVVGLIPINWVVEAALPFAGTADDLLELRGAVQYQNGGANRGAWVRWPKTIAQLGTQASLAKVAMTIASAGATVATTYSVQVQINVVMFRHQCEFGGGLSVPLANTASRFIRASLLRFPQAPGKVEAEALVTELVSDPKLSNCDDCQEVEEANK
jgi:hypothetical protein